MTFQSLTTGATAINFINAYFVSTFSYVNFADSTAKLETNVNGSSLVSGSTVTMYYSYGPSTGKTYDDDPNNHVIWFPAASARCSGLSRLPASPTPP